MDSASLKTQKWKGVGNVSFIQILLSFLSAPSHTDHNLKLGVRITLKINAALQPNFDVYENFVSGTY